MRRWWNRLFVVFIFVIAGLSVYAVWPDEPDRYLPDAIPWPSGRGVPSKILGLELPCRSTDTSSTNPATDCRGMTLGLDLQGGSRIVLQADVAGLNVSADDIDRGPRRGEADRREAHQPVRRVRVDRPALRQRPPGRRAARRERADRARHHAAGRADVLRGPAAGRPERRHGQRRSPPCTTAAPFTTSPARASPTSMPTAWSPSRDRTARPRRTGRQHRPRAAGVRELRQRRRRPDNIVWTPAKGDLERRADDHDGQLPEGEQQGQVRLASARHC